MTAIEELLAHHGVMPMSESPFPLNARPELVRERLRDHPDVRLFWPRRANPRSGGGGGRSFRPGQNHEPVVYHVDANRFDVVEAYLEANPGLMANSSLKAVHHTIAGAYPAFKDVSREVLRRRHPDQWAAEYPGEQRKD